MPSAPCRLVMPRQPAVSGRVLIVDDDERQRNALAAILSDSDLDTRVAADGLEALERLTAFPADVIVADLVMPRMDGFELLRLLKERSDLTPVIVLTGFGSMEKALSAVHDLDRKSTRLNSSHRCISYAVFC